MNTIGPGSKAGMTGLQMNKRTKTQFPSWLRRTISSDATTATRSVLTGKSLNTVCESARCPNQCECFSRQTATFLIMGDSCTRNCRFCSVKSDAIVPIDSEEPQRIVAAVRELNLKHVVITSVTRDDLVDGGAQHFSEVIRAVRQGCHGVTIEVLIPDFNGDEKALFTVCDAVPDVLNHNIEMVARLFPQVRPEGDYDRSLTLLRTVRESYPGLVVKSGFMVGLGETDDEVHMMLADLATVGCDVVTIGQYLRPSRECVVVDRFVHPDTFSEYERIGRSLGLRYVFAAPLVRSSYMAEQVLQNI